MRTRIRIAILALAVALFPSCASVHFDRTSATTGTYRSTATSFTLLSFDFPGPALTVAHSNAADAGQPNMVIEDQGVFPHLGYFDWLLDIVSIRFAWVEGLWGYPSNTGEVGDDR